MKKIFIVLGTLILAISIGLYIYSQGGYQDIHIAKGQHLEDATSKPVKDLIKIEFDKQISEYNSNLENDEAGHSIKKEIEEWNHPNPYQVLYNDSNYIYWGYINYQFLRNNVIELFKTDKSEYDKVKTQFNNITLKKSQQIISDYYNSRRFVSEQIKIVPEEVIPYWIQFNDDSNNKNGELNFLVRINNNIYKAVSYDGLTIENMSPSSLTSH